MNADARRRARISRAAVVLLAVMGGTSVACGGAERVDASSPAAEIDVPGVDTHDFTPREKHEFSRFVSELAAPCSSVAVPIATCVAEKRPCAGCMPAAQAIAKAVREGMTREQVEELYNERFNAASARTIPLEGSPSRGPEGAPVVVVEFADFECPFCQKIAPELDTTWEARKDKVRFVYKFLPLTMHPHGEVAARAAIAAQMQGKFWEMHQKLFANGKHLEGPDLEGYARAIGLDLVRFRADMDSPAVKARIEEDRKLSDSLGVKGTPTIFIDGREYDSKVDLNEWIDGELAAAGRR
jgi:2-hydroxychromene-2-carboxylate isomerase